jgi:hypothetical protein
MKPSSFNRCASAGRARRQLWRRLTHCVILAASLSLMAGAIDWWHDCADRGDGDAGAPLWTAPVLADGGAKGPNVHTMNGPCLTCHTADHDVLMADKTRAKALLRPDLEIVCNRCHGDQGASHQTGIRPKGNVPPNLPLSASGKIVCSTCHYMHGESNTFGDFVRIDNRRGGLCLSCHQLSDLQ